MLIRFVIENMFSFGERKEFTTIPNNRLKTLQDHKYNVDGFEILKLSSIYGANGAGKSNLIKSLFQFQKLITKEEIPFKLKDTQFKFGNQKEQILAIEFIQDNTALYYAIVISEDKISTEELYVSGLGKKEDKLIFERKTLNKETTIKFLDDFENDEKSQVLKTVLLEEFVKPNEPVLKLLSNRDNKFLKDVKKAYHWFSETLEIITPDSKPRALAHIIDTDIEFKKYAEDLMCSFNIGITSLGTEKKNIRDFFGEDNENELDKLIKAVEDAPKKMIGLTSRRGDEIILVKENDTIWVKTLKVGHSSSDKTAFFDLDEESDGTIRLLDFVPAFKNVISSEKVYIVDEIERSIHPLLIKELVKKFSLDKKTKGQLIFTTHESNLLDQEIFRQDEIWFAEKDINGSTDLYSLSDFKEHKTIDIRKGYLNGRYGSIPFLGNLEDLKWHDYDFNK
ncbi:AAA family ATPase [Belliella aquatica]|uniref:Transporter n=1 Tax=Belliella aquatica TaxID=1323734 RepID=A0ABQ1N2Z9_9BACT|nr:AAA family ATPase [Belliella aquatica]MCH7407106.1 AAA family ATPase [Belliella aquatica]GGC52125.1 transporter [Belliella aquatica]